jgi:hypothetical protein
MTMKNLYLPAIAAFLIFAAASCTTPRYIYSPSAHNVPVLTKKGDGKIGAAYSTNLTGEAKDDDVIVDNRSRGLDVQGAVAITDNFAIQASHFYRRERSSGGPDSMTVRYKRGLTELGIGYYMPVNERKTVFFQFFAGAGLGKFSFTDLDKFGSNFHEANITKVYLQPAMLFRSKGSFTSTVSLRASIINYSKIKTSYNASQLDDHNLDNLNNRGKVFFEPSYTASFGLKGLPAIRFEFQGGLSFLTARHLVDYRVVNFSAGAWLDFGSLFSKSR